MQLISDSFILKYKCSLDDIRPYHRSISEIQYLSNGELVVSACPSKLITVFSGKQKHTIRLKSFPRSLNVMDKNTIAVYLKNNVYLENHSVAIIDIQPTHVQYIRIIEIPSSTGTFIYIDNQFYFGDEFGIIVIDMSGSLIKRITFSFTPYNMSYDCDSQHVYCIDINKRRLLCIAIDGNIIFIFTDPGMKNLRRITIDNEGNVLVLC